MNFFTKILAKPNKIQKFNQIFKTDNKTQRLVAPEKQGNKQEY